MSRVCQITGKRSVAGNNVSHANNRNKRLFKPNLHVRKFWVESENRWIRLRVSRKGLRIIDKNGIDAVLKDVRDRGVKVWSAGVNMRDKIKLVSSAGTGHYYTTTKNKRTTPDKMEIQKYDPVVRKHVAYKEAKIK